jgi:hypothetical protein
MDFSPKPCLQDIQLWTSEVQGTAVPVLNDYAMRTWGGDLDSGLGSVRHLIAPRHCIGRRVGRRASLEAAKRNLADAVPPELSRLT